MALKRSHIDDSVSNCKKLKAYNAPEPDFMNYLSVPSLESMSIVSIVTAFYKQTDILRAIQKHSLRYDPVGNNCCPKIRGTAHDRSFREIVKKVCDKVIFLPIPTLLKVKVCDIVRPIQSQILSWICHSSKDIEYINSIFLSPEGTIDKIKTLKHLIGKDKDQHVSNYYLACKYCLEECIHSLWNKLPEKAKKDFLCGEKNIYEDYENHLIAYWTHNISKDLSRFIEKIRPNDYNNLYDFKGSIYKNMFKLALFTNNILAIKYFWNKLTHAEISSNLTVWVQLTVRKRKHSVGSYQTGDENADILYFLLSKINYSEQNEILQKNSRVILNSLFLDWPWQRFLLPTINLLWKYIDEKVYVDLLNNIGRNINKGGNVGNVFSRLWSDSPVNLKRHFIQSVLTSYLNTIPICHLLIVKNVGTIKAILEYASIEDQKQIIFSLIESPYFTSVVHPDKLHVFDDLCLDILAQSEMKCMKNKIVCKYGNRACRKWIERDKWDKVEAFLNWAFDTEEQIKHFKNEVIKKIEITYSLLYDKNNYELTNKFLSWCFDSEVDIHRFKIYFAKSKPEIFEIGCEDWKLFEEFVDWCFKSDEEIKNFKLILSQSQIMKSVFYCIAISYEFDFIENVINWCFTSQEEMKEFKAILALSDKWMHILQRFVSNYKIYDCEWNNWELIKKLLKLVTPLDEDVIIKLKEKISLVIRFDRFRGDYKNRSFMIQKEDLFRLLDKGTYDKGVGDAENEVSNCDSDIKLVLTEVLNKVESNLQGESH